jgi:hypothetical protein
MAIDNRFPERREEIRYFFNEYYATITAMRNKFITESRTFEEKSQHRKQTKTESRTFEEKSQMRKPTTTESRTFEEKSIARKQQTQTESFPNVMQHSKIQTSPFYSDQRIYNDIFKQLVENNPASDELLDELLTHKSEGCNDPAANMVVETLIDRVIPCVLTLSDTSKFFVPPTDIINFVNAIPIDNSRYLMPRHFFYSKEGTMIRSTATQVYRIIMNIDGINHPIDFDPARLTIIKTNSGYNTDAILYDVSRTSVPPGKANLSKFINDKDLSLIRPGDVGVMIGNTIIKNQPQKFHKTFTLTPLTKQLTYNHAPNCNFTVYTGISYAAATAKGDCGAPIILHKAGLNNKIIGIHSYGHETDLDGGGMIVTQEMLLRALPERPIMTIKELDVTFTTKPIYDDIKMKTQDLTIQICGELLNPIYVNRDTIYVETPFKEKFGDLISHPSQKHSHEGIDPLLTGAMLFGSQLNNITDTDFRMPVLDYLCNEYVPVNYAKVLTAFEAVNKYYDMDRLNLATSAGYPYNTRGQSKLTFLSCDTEGTISFKESAFEHQIQSYLDSYRTTIHEIPWVVSLKDCLDKPNKLCRIFEIPPLEYTVACRAYFGSWISMMHSNVGNSFCYVGINPESLEWNKLFHKLASVSEYGIDADAPNWDKNLSSVLVFWGAASINLWYKANDPNWTLQDDLARDNLITGLVYGYLLAGPLVIRKLKGMPSGHVLTALLNSIVNMIMHLIWYLVSVPLEYRSLSLYNKYVATAIYGDDSLDAIATPLLPYLNRNSMIFAYSKYCSMTITSSQKDGTIIPYEPIVGLTFLRRGFRRDGCLVKPTLALRSLYSMVAYVKKSKHVTLEEQLLNNIRVFLSFAYFYGPEYYNKLRNYFKSVYPNQLFADYAYFDNMYLYGQYDIEFISS